MIVNGKETGLILLTSEYLPRAYNSNDEGVGLVPIFNQGSIGFGSLKIELWVSENTKQAYSVALSNIAALLQKCTIQIGGLVYECNRSGNLSENMIAQYQSKVTVVFKCYMHSLERTQTVTNGSKVTIGGNLPTYATFTITPVVSASKIIIQGIEIKNVTQGKKIVINGDKRTVMEEGKNKFKDTNLYSFPKLKVGENTISITGNVAVQLTYKENYQ